MYLLMSFNIHKTILLVFLSIGGFTLAQDIANCEFNERFSQDNYFYSSSPNNNLSNTELNEKLVSSIFSLIKTESKLELTNIDGESKSDFTQLSMVKSEAFLINPNQCQKNDGSVVVYVSKTSFNASFLSDYYSKIVLLKKRIASLKASELSRESTFLKNDIQNIKKDFERLNFYLPFANSISDITHDSEINVIYESLTELEIYSLSLEDRILRLEQNYLIMDCKESLQKVSSITSLELSRTEQKRLKTLRKNIESNCSVAFKKDLKIAKQNSNLFNNLELALYIQSYPINISSELPKTEEFNLESPFLAGRLNYFLGISDTGLRFGPYIRFFYLGGAILGESDNGLDFSDSFTDLGLTVRYRLIKGLLQFELGVGRSVNAINPIANINGEPFNFITVSPGIILGSSKKISIILGVDYLSADNNSNYKYLSAKLGLNYNIPFKKISKYQRSSLKNKYEIKN